MKMIPLAVCILLLAIPAVGTAQRVAHANVELIIAYMPETQAMNQELQSLQESYNRSVQRKREHAQTRIGEFQRQSEAQADEAVLAGLQEELAGLERELQEFVAEADRDIRDQRAEKMGPISAKLSTTIREVAAAKGFDYVLNSVDSGGTSILLHAPEKANLTLAVMEALGLSVPTPDNAAGE